MLLSNSRGRLIDANTRPSRRRRSAGHCDHPRRGHADRGAGQCSHRHREPAGQAGPADPLHDEPDGSSGATEGGEGIPNIDSVKSTIRTYYDADRPASPTRRTRPTSARCSRCHPGHGGGWPRAESSDRRRGRHKKPAIVFDADDTTLWTYDMEDAACISTSTRRCRTCGSRTSASRRPRHGRLRQQGRRRRLRRLRPDRPQRHPEGGHGRQPRQGRLHGRSTTDHVLHQVGRSAGTPEPDYITCAAGPPARRSSTRPAPAPTSRASATTSSLNVGDQWSDLQGGYADHVLKLPNPTYYLPSPNLPALRRAAARAAHAVHHGAGRLERRRPRAARASPTSTR